MSRKAAERRAAPDSFVEANLWVVTRGRPYKPRFRAERAVVVVSGGGAVTADAEVAPPRSVHGARRPEPTAPSAPTRPMAAVLDAAACAEALFARTACEALYVLDYGPLARDMPSELASPYPGRVAKPASRLLQKLNPTDVILAADGADAALALKLLPTLGDDALRASVVRHPHRIPPAGLRALVGARPLTARPADVACAPGGAPAAEADLRGALPAAVFREDEDAEADADADLSGAFAAVVERNVRALEAEDGVSGPPDWLATDDAPVFYSKVTFEHDRRSKQIVQRVENVTAAVEAAKANAKAATAATADANGATANGDADADAAGNRGGENPPTSAGLEVEANVSEPGSEPSAAATPSDAADGAAADAAAAAEAAARAAISAEALAERLRAALGSSVDPIAVSAAASAAASAASASASAAAAVSSARLLARLLSESETPATSASVPSARPSVEKLRAALDACLLREDEQDETDPNHRDDSDSMVAAPADLREDSKASASASGAASGETAGASKPRPSGKASLQFGGKVGVIRPEAFVAPPKGVEVKQFPEGTGHFWPKMPCLECGSPWWLGDDWDAECANCGEGAESYDDSQQPHKEYKRRFERFRKLVDALDRGGGSR